MGLVAVSHLKVPTCRKELDEKLAHWQCQKSPGQQAGDYNYCFKAIIKDEEGIAPLTKDALTGRKQKRQVDTYVSAGPMLLDFGAGLIRYEIANDVDTLECDADMFVELGVDQLCEPGTYGVRKRLRTQTPEGECPSHQTRKHRGHLPVQTIMYQMRAEGSTPVSNPRITPPHTQPTPTSNTRRSRSGPPTEYKRFGPCDCIALTVRRSFRMTSDLAVLLDIQAHCIIDDV
ncbi:hypothetical protein CTI12_AA082990 [Artemisia annua]|uniref:Uncharacterized protein n=1 Tax=Artemisia annua TaxID=35608 RepID=A0A2U1PVZ5_ARTAN|nr:hypothetical protein CTI12_AA082990 [Artemisia annua]